VLAIVGQIAYGLQPGNRGRVSGVLVGVDDTRRLLDPLKDAKARTAYRRNFLLS